MRAKGYKPVKKIVFLLFLLLGQVIWVSSAKAQEEEIAQLLLNVEKLAQFKSILSDMKKGYEILDGGYNTIKDLSEGNFSLHKAFLDGLMAVSPEVRNYRKVALIIEYQVRLVSDYNSAFTRFKAGGHFRLDEIEYLGKVYNNLLSGSLKNLYELSMVLTANQLRMTDDERLRAIDRIYADMEDKLQFLKYFNTNNSILALQRQKEERQIRSVKVINGIKD